MSMRITPNDLAKYEVMYGPVEESSLNCYVVIDRRREPVWVVTQEFLKKCTEIFKGKMDLQIRKSGLSVCRRLERCFTVYRNEKTMKSIEEAKVIFRRYSKENFGIDFLREMTCDDCETWVDHQNCEWSGGSGNEFLASGIVKKSVILDAKCESHNSSMGVFFPFIKILEAASLSTDFWGTPYINNLGQPFNLDHFTEDFEGCVNRCLVEVVGTEHSMKSICGISEEEKVRGIYILKKVKSLYSLAENQIDSNIIFTLINVISRKLFSNTKTSIDRLERLFISGSIKED